MTAQTITFDEYRGVLISLLTEAFDRTERGNMFLDQGDELKKTLEDVTAEEASIVIGGEGGNSIADQVRHLTYYLEIGHAWMTNPPPANVDWSAAWQAQPVDDAEWQQLQDDLWSWKEQIYADLQEPRDTFSPDEVAGGMGMLAHAAFHLGQIRHALMMIRANDVRTK